MAILDDEEDDAEEYEAPEAAPIPARRSALDAYDEDQGYGPSAAGDADYGAGGDEEGGVTLPRGTQLPALPAARRRSAGMQKLLDETQQLLRERAARNTGGPADLRTLSSSLSDPDFRATLKTAPVETEVEKQPEKEPGWIDILGRGVARAHEGLAQGKDIAEGKRPRKSKTEEAEYEKPLELGDVGSPSLLAKKLVFGFAASYPSMALGMLGSFAGGAAGSAVPVVGTTIGGIAGGAAGMGIGSALQEVGPAYLSELEALPEGASQEQIDKAWDNAMVTVAKSGVVGAASMALLGAGKPFSNFIKGTLAKTAGKTVAADAVAGMPTRIGLQTVGQPAIAVGAEVAANAAEGKPLGTNLDPAAAGALSNVIQDAAGMAGGRLLRRVVRGRAKPGVTEEQAAALNETQPPPSEPGMPPGATQAELPLVGGRDAVPRPPSAGPDTDMLRRPPSQPDLPLTMPGPLLDPSLPEQRAPGGDPAQMRLPDITGPGRQPLGEQRFTPQPPEPTQGTLPGFEPPTAGAPVRGPQVEMPLEGGAENPARMVGGQRIPENMPFTDDGATSIGAAARPIGQVGPEPTNLTLRVSDPTAQPDMFRTPEGQVRGPQGELLQDFNVGGRRVSGDAPVLETARRTGRDTGAERPIGRLVEESEAAGRADTGEQLALPGVKTQEGWTFERDHTGPGYVVKNADGNVISVGDSQEQALRFARERHPDQVAAKTEPRMKEETGPATIKLPEKPLAARDVTTPAEARATREARAGEKAPPAEAARAEPTAQEGGNAASEPRQGQTPAEQRKATAQAKLTEVKERAAGRPKVGDEVTVDLDGRYQVGDVVKIGRSKIHVKVGSRVWPLDPAKVAMNAGEKAAEVKAKALKAGEAAEQIIADRKAEAEARVKRVTDKAKARAEARVTESTSELRTETGSERATVTEPSEDTEKSAPPGQDRAKAALVEYDKATADWVAGRISKADLDKAKAVYNQKIRDIEGGERTKAGAFTMGEGEEMPVQRVRKPTISQAKQEEIWAARRKRDRDLLSPETKQMRRMARDEEPVSYSVTPGLESSRKAASIMKNLLKGQSFADAIEAFGAKPRPGKPGPKPNVESLSQFLRGELAKTEGVDVEADIRSRLQAAAEELAKVNKEARTTTPELAEASAAASERIKKILDNLHAELNDLELIRATRPQLEDAANKIATLEAGGTIKGVESRISPQSVSARTVEAMSKLGAVNEPVLWHIERAGETGASLHEILDDFIANPIAAHATPHMTELAQILRRIIPETKVYQGEGAIGERLVGLYEPFGQTIHINTKEARRAGSGAVTLLHETVHRGVLDYTSHLYTTPEIQLTPRELAHKTALQAIRAEVSRVIDEGDLRRSFTEVQELQYALREYDADNVRGPQELATQLLTQPEVYNILSRETASPEFRARLDNVGMGIPVKASIWDGFKRIVRSIFGVPDKLDSVLDYSMRPLTEILETGAKFRPQDVAEHRAITRQNNEMTGPAKLRDAWSLRNLRRGAGDVVGPTGRRVMEGLYQAATLSAIHDMIRPHIPTVTLHRKALEAVTRATEDERTRLVTTHDAQGKEVVEPHIDKTMRLLRELKRGPDGHLVQPLMTEATLAEVSLVDPKRNAHLVTKEQIETRDRLQERFDKLDPAARQTYREVNELYNDRDRVAREARVRQFTEAALDDLTPAQRDDVVAHMSTVGGIEDILNNVDRSALAGRLGAKWANSKDLINILAKTERGGFVRGDYFPAARYGEYVVYAGTANTPDYGVWMFEKNSEAKSFKRDLEAGNIENQPARRDVSQVFTKSKQGFTEGMRLDQALGTLDAAMARAGLGENSQKVLRDLYAGQLIQQGQRIAARSMRREGITGASNEQARNLLVDFMGHSSRVGHLQHHGEVLRTQFQMEKEVSTLRGAGHGTPIGVDADGKLIYPPAPQAGATDVAIAQLGVEELRKRLAPVDGDISADLMGRSARVLTTVTLMDALIRPAHLVMQLAGTHIAAYSLIAGRHGVGSVFGLTKAYMQLAGPMGRAATTNAIAAYHRELKAAHWDVAKLYRERLYKADDISRTHVDMLIDELNRANLINQTRIREMQRMAGPDGWFGANGPIGFMGRALDIFGAGEHAVDSMMRTATAKAAFVAELKKNGGDATAAVEYAKQVARNASPDYNHYNKSRFATAQGVLGKKAAPLIMQFKQFGLHMYGVQGSLIAEGLRNASTKEAKREAWKTLAYLQGSHALMYGGIGASIFGSVPAMVSFGLYDYLSGDDRPHTNKEMQTRARNWVKDMTGSKTLADVFDRGVPMSLGIDAHRSLMFTNLVGVPELNAFNSRSYMEFFAALATGASGSAVTGLVDAASAVRKGDTSTQTLLKLAPRFIEDPLVAATSWRTEGLKDTKGRTIVPAKDFSTGDLIAKGLGFIPKTSSDAREARGVMDLQKKVVEDAHRDILNRVVRAKPADRKEAIAEVYRYNKTAPPNDRITGQQIQSRFREQAKINAQPKHYGMQVPRQDSRSAIESTRFARP